MARADGESVADSTGSPQCLPSWTTVWSCWHCSGSWSDSRLSWQHGPTWLLPDVGRGRVGSGPATNSFAASPQLSPDPPGLTGLVVEPNSISSDCDGFCFLWGMLIQNGTQRRVMLLGELSQLFLVDNTAPNTRSDLNADYHVHIRVISHIGLLPDFGGLEMCRQLEIALWSGNPGSHTCTLDSVVSDAREEIRGMVTPLTGTAHMLDQTVDREQVHHRGSPSHTGGISMWMLKSSAINTFELSRAKLSRRMANSFRNSLHLQKAFGGTGRSCRSNDCSVPGPSTLKLLKGQCVTVFRRCKVPLPNDRREKPEEISNFAFHL